MNRIHLLFACLIALMACRGDEPKRMPDTLPDLSGTIATIAQAGAEKNTAQLLVKASEAQQQNHTEASINVTENTLIEDKDGKYLKITHLQQGQQVQVWFEGDVMESMPVQATAKAIRVQERQ